MQNKDKCADCKRNCVIKRMKKSSYDKRLLCWNCYIRENNKIVSELTSVSESGDSVIDLKFHEGGDVGGRSLINSRIAKDLSNQINSIKAEQKLRRENGNRIEL